MQGTPTFVADLAVVAGVAAITGMAARAVRLPPILGYLAAGLLVGPAIPIPLFADPHRTEALAEFGVILVMFAVGLEFRVRRLLDVLPRAGFTALVQIAFLGWCGFTLGTLLGQGALAAAFLGASLAISSTMIVTGLFSQIKVLDDVREHVLGVLVVQDVVAVALIAVMTALAAGQSVAAGELVTLLAQLAGVLIGMVAVGILVVPRLVRWVVREGGTEGIAVLAVGLAFGFAVLAETFGYSVALGAFVAGVLVAESGRATEVDHAIEPLRAVFAAIFFVSIGMAVEPWLALQNLHVALLVAAVVIAAQLASVSVASVLSGNPLRRSVVAGLALGQIGELSFILATIGREGGVVSEGLLPTLVTVATITAFTTPLLLRRRDSIVAFVDNAVPVRVQHLLAVHQTWVERVRRGADRPMRRALGVIVVDWVALLLLAVTVATFSEAAGNAVRARTGLSDTAAAALVDVVALVLAAPLLVGLFRTARRLAQRAAALVAAEGEPSVGRRAGQRALGAVANLALVVGVGLPALAVLRPLVRGPWGEPLLVAGLVTAAVLVWRDLGALEGEFRSGVGELASQLARGAGSDEDRFVNDQFLPGLDRVLGVTLSAGAHAVGRTLAELDLRARIGVTVVAIHRPDEDVALPTGHERLQEGDMLALAGPTTAMQGARALLIGGEPDAAGS